MLPLVLRHSEIARYEGGKLYTLDRRRYPLEKKYYVMQSVKEVATAIKNMVTQGGGPMELALHALLLAKDQGVSLSDAYEILSSSRPTNKSMANTLKEVIKRVEEGEDLGSLINSTLAAYDEAYDKMSDYGASLIKDGDGILTTCFAEHSFFLSLKKAMLDGKRVRVYVPETRPYLQGSRLTLPSLSQMGIEAYLITDGMPAFFMARGDINIYMTASDAILPDYSVSNKIGTLEHAIAASYYGIPYYPFSLKSSYNSDIKIEMRDEEEVLKVAGCYVTDSSLHALYPAFDIIPPCLIKGIITKDGVLKPFE